MAIKIKTQVPGLKPVQNQTQTKLEIEEFSTVSFDGQNTINFPTGKYYITDTNSIFIFIDGMFLTSVDYKELTSTVVKLNSPIKGSGKKILVRWFNKVPEITSTIPPDTAGVVVSIEEPKDKQNGLIWFNPDWNGSMAVWNSANKEFQEVALKRDIVDAGVQTSLDGGSF